MEDIIIGPKNRDRRHTWFHPKKKRHHRVSPCRSLTDMKRRLTRYRSEVALIATDVNNSWTSFFWNYIVSIMITEKKSNETMKATESKVEHWSVSDETLRIITDIISRILWNRKRIKFNVTRLFVLWSWGSQIRTSNELKQYPMFRLTNHFPQKKRSHEFRNTSF